MSKGRGKDRNEEDEEEGRLNEKECEREGEESSIVSHYLPLIDEVEGEV